MIDMLSGISKALEYENDWTQLKDGVLECRLRDQYDGEHTGLARVTVNKAARCPLWHGRTIRMNTRPCPTPTGHANTIQPTRRPSQTTFGTVARTAGGNLTSACANVARAAVFFWTGTTGRTAIMATANTAIRG